MKRYVAVFLLGMMVGWFLTNYKVSIRLRPAIPVAWTRRA